VEVEYSTARIGKIYKYKYSHERYGFLRKPFLFLFPIYYKFVLE